MSDNPAPCWLNTPVGVLGSTDLASVISERVLLASVVAGDWSAGERASVRADATSSRPELLTTDKPEIADDVFLALADDREEVIDPPIDTGAPGVHTPAVNAAPKILRIGEGSSNRVADLSDGLANSVVPFFVIDRHAFYDLNRACSELFPVGLGSEKSYGGDAAHKSIMVAKFGLISVHQSYVIGALLELSGRRERSGVEVRIILADVGSDLGSKLSENFVPRVLRVTDHEIVASHHQFRFLLIGWLRLVLGSDILDPRSGVDQWQKEVVWGENERYMF